MFFSDEYGITLADFQNLENFPKYDVSKRPAGFHESATVVDNEIERREIDLITE